MGSTMKKRKDVRDKSAKRKRRKRARTEVSSSSSSSSSSESEKEVVGKLAETQDEEEEKPEAPMIVEASDSDVEVDAAAKFSKNGKIPPQLRDLHDSCADEKFQEYYMTYITREHADDLETLRSASDFTDRSLPLLIRALRSGVNIFDKEEKATIVGLAQAGGSR